MNSIRFISKTSTLLSALSFVIACGIAFGANHREAPITALDHKADITDWYAFVSYDDPTKVTMILNVDPLLEPSNGPTFFPFDPEILYEMKIDNNQDGEEDIIFQFRFNSEYRLPQVFTSLIGAGNGLVSPSSSPAPVPPGTLIVPPQITALDGPGSEGLNLRQSYTVKMVKVKKGYRTESIDLTGGKKLFAVPTNAGPRTMGTPGEYEALAKQGIYELGNGIKVFAGTVDDPFYIDLGAAFDTLNLRKGASQLSVPGVLSSSQDADDANNYAPDDVAGFNVNSIALEVPIALLTSDGKTHSADDPRAVLGTYGSTSRPRTKIQALRPGGKPILSKNFAQIQRMGNPLINELIIGIGDKDKFSMSDPKNDKQFASYFLDPLLPRALNAAYGDVLPVPDAPRTDLLPLVKYVAPICPNCSAQGKEGPIADLLRLNTGIGPAAKASRKRIGFLAGDSAGYPNGRRVSDDVTDISLRVVAGVLKGPPFNGFPHTQLGDGTNANDVPYQETFPYVQFANSGRNSRHVDPGEPGCNGANCPTD